MENKQILELFLRRDEGALAESERCFGYACTRLAQNILESGGDAEACTREALRLAWESIPPESPENLGAYLLKITRRLALERYNASHAAKRGTHLFTITMDELSECVSGQDTDFQKGFDRETVEVRVGARIRRFLDKQPREVRELFLCRYFYADSLGEISRRFGWSEDRIHTRLRRTRQRLRHFLENEDGGAGGFDPDTLARGLNHMDDAAILAAHGRGKRVRHLIPWLGAACIVSVVAVSFPFLREVINTDLTLRAPDWRKELYGSHEVGSAAQDDPSSHPWVNPGLPATVGETTFTVTDVTDTTATVTLVKKDSTPVYAAVYDLRGDALGCTQPDYKVNGALIQPYTLLLYVDGATEPTYELPTAPGTYTVTVDVSRIRNGAYPMRDCMGFFSYTGEDGAPETVYFSVLTETDESERGSDSEDTETEEQTVD